MGELAERRGHRRHDVAGEALAIIKAERTTVGQIRDISLSGMMMESFAASPGQGQTASVDIMIRQFGFFLADVTCRVVWRGGCPGEAGRTNRVQRSCCGVCFDGPERQQTAMAQLDELLASGVLEAMEGSGRGLSL